MEPDFLKANTVIIYLLMLYCFEIVMRNKNRPDGLHRRAGSIDGIVPRAGSLGVPVHRSYRPTDRHRTPTLDSFGRRSEGFHPARANPQGLGVTAAEEEERDTVLDEPIVLDDLNYEKRKDKVRGRIKRARFKKKFKRAGLVLLALIIATAALIGYKFYLTQKHVLSGGGHAPAVCDGDVPLEELHKEGDGRVNILLLGRGGPGHEGSDLTDTIMIASLDPFTHKIDLLSIPRDLWVNIPGDGQHKINQAYSDIKNYSSAKTVSEKQKAGLKAIDSILKNVIGVDIHYNVLLDFKAFQDIVGALGGVDAYVPKNLTAYETFWIEGSNPIRYYTLNVPAGWQHFDSTKALYYARERHNDSDFVRGERQQLLLTAIKDKALSAGTYTNPIKIVKLLNSLGHDVYTDFDSSSIRCLTTEIAKIPSNKIKSHSLALPPHQLITTSYLYGSSIVKPVTGLFNYSDIHTYVRELFRDGLLARENAPVAIYNATNKAGLATAKADILRTYGYNVTTVANAPNQTNPAFTAIVDLSKGKNKYTRNYLEQRFHVVANGKYPPGTGINPPQGTAFVIILGEDAANSQ